MVLTICSEHAFPNFTTIALILNVLINLYVFRLLMILDDLQLSEIQFGLARYICLTESTLSFLMCIIIEAKYRSIIMSILKYITLGWILLQLLFDITFSVQTAFYLYAQKVPVNSDNSIEQYPVNSDGRGIVSLRFGAIVMTFNFAFKLYAIFVVGSHISDIILETNLSRDYTTSEHGSLLDNDSSSIMLPSYEECVLIQNDMLPPPYNEIDKY